MEQKEKLERLTILLKKEDLEILENLSSERSLGVSTFVRFLALEYIRDLKVKRYLQKLETEANLSKNDTD